LQLGLDRRLATWRSRRGRLATPVEAGRLLFGAGFVAAGGQFFGHLALDFDRVGVRIAAQPDRAAPDLLELLPDQLDLVFEGADARPDGDGEAGEGNLERRPLGLETGEVAFARFDLDEEPRVGELLR
jgi:hypothetical protein